MSERNAEGKVGVPRPSRERAADHAREQTTMTFWMSRAERERVQRALGDAGARVGGERTRALLRLLSQSSRRGSQHK